MTIWNWHSSENEMGKPIPTEIAIAQDIVSGTFWYRVDKPPRDADHKQWIAHWNGLNLAFLKGIPVIGVLKDFYSNNCSLEHIFDIGNPHMQKDGSALWLQLKPHTSVGCEVSLIDICQLISLDLEVQQEVQQLGQFNKRFESAVNDALQRNAAERKARLAAAPRLPRRVEVITTVFARNPDVVVEVLLRAQGCCEVCEKDAPFIRKSDGSPYLEVHHRIPLAAGGEDVVENAFALCPNCHREAHYG